MKAPVGIVAAACHLPAQRRSVDDLVQEEGATFNSDISARLGIDQVPLRDGDGTETASNMAVAAAREALQRAKVEPITVDVVIEYSFMPQEYLVPVWNMSNKVQAEVGASKSFVIGFSGGDSSNFSVALSSAAAILSENDAIKTALLVTGDTTIAGNRVLNPPDPVTVLGDGASAVVLQRGNSTGVVVDAELWSEPDNQDICYIPGGSLIHPDDISLYRLQLDKARYDSFPKQQTLRQMTDRLLARSGLTLADIHTVLCANISAEDEAALQEAFDGKISSVCGGNRQSHGHLFGTDLPLNYLSLIEQNGLKQGEHILLISHGMGTTAAVSLLRY
jgi:3-oxoacyl-[acyl-carrier-protein] synthase III